MQAANDNLLAASRGHAAQGLWPIQYRVAPGTVLYRFIDSTRVPPLIAADGPWWFEFEQFQTIKHFALQHGYTLGYAARLFAAILYEWSEVNAFVRAQSLVPLVVWKGRGKQIVVGRDRPLYHPEVDARDVNRTLVGMITERTPLYASKMTPMQGPNEVYQLYVPGLGRPYFRFAQYFKYLTSESIATG
jgi:hypothetical protein